MQIIISLLPDFPVRLPFSYYHALSSGIYETFRNFDEELTNKLHNGPTNAERIKLLAISPLFSSMMEVHGGGKGSHQKEQQDDYYLLFKGETFFRIATPIPEMAHACVAAFSNVEFLRIGSQVFRVKSVEMISEPVFKNKMIWCPIGNSSIVTGWTVKQEGKKLYQFPVDSIEKAPDCNELLKGNLIHKWKRLVEQAPDVCTTWTGCKNPSDSGLKCLVSGNDISLDILLSHDHLTYKTRLHLIKNNPVRSWRAPVIITAPEWIQKLIWNCGLGQNNTMGFGLVQEVIS